MNLVSLTNKRCFVTFVYFKQFEGCTRHTSNVLINSWNSICDVDETALRHDRTLDAGHFIAHDRMAFCTSVVRSIDLPQSVWPLTLTRCASAEAVHQSLASVCRSRRLNINQLFASYPSLRHASFRSVAVQFLFDEKVSWLRNWRLQIQ